MNGRELAERLAGEIVGTPPGPRPARGATMDDLLEALHALLAQGKDGWPYGRPGMGPGDGPTGTAGMGAYGAYARFLQPTDETTLTWGDTQSFTATTADVSSAATTTRQLVHVARPRPTTFTVLLNVLFGNGWSTEPSITFTLIVFVGVGQAKTTVKKTYTVATPAPGSTILDTLTIPANAIQCQASFAGLVQPGEHDVNVTILAAPVYA